MAKRKDFNVVKFSVEFLIMSTLITIHEKLFDKRKRNKNLKLGRVIRNVHTATSFYNNYFLIKSDKHS